MKPSTTLLRMPNGSLLIDRTLPCVSRTEGPSCWTVSVPGRWELSGTSAALADRCMSDVAAALADVGCHVYRLTPELWINLEALAGAYLNEVPEYTSTLVPTRPSSSLVTARRQPTGESVHSLVLHFLADPSASAVFPCTNEASAIAMHDALHAAWAGALETRA